MEDREIVNVHDAKTHLSRLLARVEEGHEIVLARAGKPIAKLVPYGEASTRILGRDEELFDVPDDFDEPLTDEILRSFEQ